MKTLREQLEKGEIWWVHCIYSHQNQKTSLKPQDGHQQTIIHYSHTINSFISNSHLSIFPTEVENLNPGSKNRQGNARTSISQEWEPQLWHLLEQSTYPYVLFLLFSWSSRSEILGLQVMKTILSKTNCCIIGQTIYISLRLNTSQNCLK